MVAIFRIEICVLVSRIKEAYVPIVFIAMLGSMNSVFKGELNTAIEFCINLNVLISFPGLV